MTLVSRRAAMVFALAPARPAAAAIALPPLAQGSLLTSHVPPGTRLSLDGRALRVAADGAFACGFGRDHGPTATLVAIRPDGAREEQRLAIARRDWPTQQISGLPPAQVTPDAVALARINAEREGLAAARATDTGLTGFAGRFVWPASGRISGVFGSQRILNGEPRQPHYGLDVAAPVGAPVAATAAGRVTLAAEFFFFGRLLVLDHGHGVNSLYAHLSAINVRVGEAVAAGQRIGAVGATGRVTGPHLHFSLSWFATWLDPFPVLPAAG